MKTIPGAVGLKLYKYRPFDEYSIALLERSEAYFSSPSSLNDPFDCTFTYLSPPPSAEDARNWMRYSVSKIPRSHFLFGELSSRALNTAENFTDTTASIFMKMACESMEATIRNESSVYCLSTTNDSTLMFSHYAQSHKGICIEFNFTNEFRLGDPEAVSYFSTPPVVDFWGEDRFDGNLLVERSVYAKSVEWEYENEWRIFNFSKGAGIRTFDPRCVSRVIVGCNAGDDTKKRVIEISKNRQFPFKISLAKMSREKNKLELIDLEM
jgi:Protein of unknown function (DUF2971)